MYRLFILLSSLIAHSCCGQEVDFTVSGKFVNEVDSKTLYLSGEDFNDSVKLQGDMTFSFQGKLKKPGELRLITEDTYLRSIWINGGSIQLEVEEYKGTSQDTKARKYLNIRSLKGPLEAELYQHLQNIFLSIASKYSHRDVLGTDSLGYTYFPFVKAFVERNPTSYMSAFLAEDYPFTLGDQKVLLTLLKENPNIEYIDLLKTQIDQKERTRKGTIVQDFFQPTSTGKVFKLHSLKRRFVLIQFWASWCYPCRAENPELVALYSKYKSKGFDIVGISLDDNNAAWMKALKEDQLPWINVSDLLGFKNTVAQKFKVYQIPFNILIDSSYSIIATSLWPSQIKEILSRNIK